MKSNNINDVKPRPERAEALQPDLPGVGGEREEGEPKLSPKEADAKSRKQSRMALDNVREGYGG